MFQSKRKELRLHNEQQERNMFNELYPRVTSHNYEEHRNLLKCFSSNENYNFLLLPLAGLAFDYLLLSPHDEDSWGIVEELTQFDEFDVPLTEDFAALLLDNMRLRIITVLTIIDNLASMPYPIQGSAGIKSY